MATVDLKPGAIWSLIQSWIGWLAGQLLWLAWVGMAVSLFVWVATEYGFRIPFLYAPGSPTTWIYAAGVYYLIRK